MIKDIGLVLDKKHYRENKLIVELYTKSNGVCRVLVNKKIRIYQKADLVEVCFRTQPNRFLNFAKIDVTKSFLSYIISDHTKVLLASLITSIILSFLKVEKDHDLFDIIVSYLRSLVKKVSVLEYIDLELLILSSAGYRLSMDRCAATNSKQNLFFVSPKTARAVSYEAARGYENKLLKLPQFILEKSEPLNSEDIKDAFNLTGYFFRRYLKCSASLNSLREAVLKKLVQNLASSS